jgi:hypothetical protein
MLVDFSLGKDHRGGFVEYHERTSKNGKASLKRFQPEHFRMAVRNYEEDVVDTFRRYLSHFPEDVEAFFLSVIDNPRTCVWYSKTVMGMKSLRNVVKNILVENGLDAEEFTNNSGRTTLVTRMAEAGVPPEVGMDVTGECLSVCACICAGCFFGGLCAKMLSVSWLGRAYEQQVISQV